MSLHSRGLRSRGSARSSSQSSAHSPHSSAASVFSITASPSPKPSTAHYCSPSSPSKMEDSPARGNLGFEKKLKRMLGRVCHTSGGSVRSEFEQRLYHEMNAFISSGASQLFDISCRYDRSLVGAPKEGESANGLHMIHGHYSAQQNIAEKGNGGEFTFAQVMAANATLSVAEFSKFLTDMAPFRLPTVALTGIFQMMNAEEANCNLGGGTLEDDDNASDEMQIDEFIKAVVCVAIYCYSDSMSHEDAVRTLAHALMLDQPYALRERIKVLARMCAGFGAWRAPSDEVAKFQRSVPPTKRRQDLLTDLLPQPFSQEMKNLTDLLKSQSPVIPILKTIAFPGPYIALSVPADKCEVRAVRCFVTVRNMSERVQQIWFRVNGLSWLNMKTRSSARTLGCGMSMTAEAFFDVCDGPLGEHLGGFQVMSQQDLVYEVPVYFNIVRVMEKHQACSDAVQRAARGGDMGKAAIAAIKLHSSVGAAGLRSMFEAADDEEPVHYGSSKDQSRLPGSETKGKMLPASFASAFKSGGLLDKKCADNLTQCVLKMQSSNSHVDVMDFLNVRLPLLLKSGRDKLNGAVATNVAALQTSEKEEAEEAALKNGMCVVSSINSPVPMALARHFDHGKTSPSKSATPASAKLPAIVQLRGILRNSPT